MTLQQLQERLAAYLAAETRILQSQEYTIGDGGTARRNKRAELLTVQAGIAELREQIAKAEAAGRRRILYVR